MTLTRQQKILVNWCVGNNILYEFKSPAIAATWLRTVADRRIGEQIYELDGNYWYMILPNGRKVKDAVVIGE